MAYCRCVSLAKPSFVSLCLDRRRRIVVYRGCNLLKINGLVVCLSDGVLDFLTTPPQGPRQRRCDSLMTALSHCDSAVIAERHSFCGGTPPEVTSGLGLRVAARRWALPAVTVPCMKVYEKEKGEPALRFSSPAHWVRRPCRPNCKTIKLAAQVCKN